MGSPPPSARFPGKDDHSLHVWLEREGVVPGPEPVQQPAEGPDPEFLPPSPPQDPRGIINKMGNAITESTTNISLRLEGPCTPRRRKGASASAPSVPSPPPSFFMYARCTHAVNCLHVNALFPPTLPTPIRVGRELHRVSHQDWYFLPPVAKSSWRT